MAKIATTQPHFVRCIKPNDAHAADCLDRPRVVEQLRYGGVLEAVRVARAGFPVRYPHAQFAARCARARAAPRARRARRRATRS